MSADRPDTTLDALLEFVKETPRLRLHRLQALDDPASRRQADGGGRRRALRRLPRLSRAARRGVRRAVQHAADQHHRLLPRSPDLGVPGDRDRPQLLAARAPDSALRVWCAGCASGEEPYTVAMVLARVMGDAAFRERVKIYATDVDEEALDQARHGAYVAAPDRGRAARRARALLRAHRPALRVPQGPAAVRDLRPQRPGPGRADLAHRSARVPQHAHVLHRGDAGADPAALPLRARRRRLPAARQVRDADHAHRPVRAGRAQAAGVPEGDQADAPRSRPRDGGRRRPRRPVDRGREPARGGVRHRRRRADRARPRPRDDHGQRRGAQDVRLGARRLRPAASGPRAVLPPDRASQPPRLARSRPAAVRDQGGSLARAATASGSSTFASRRSPATGWRWGRASRTSTSPSPTGSRTS